MSHFLNLQGSIETHDGPFMVVDENQNILAINSAFCRSFGVLEKELTGQSCSLIFDCSDEVNGDKLPPFSANETVRDIRVKVQVNGDPNALQVSLNTYPLLNSESGSLTGVSVSVESVPVTDGDGMVGESTSFLRMKEQLMRAASSDIPVLLEGETGTGKEVATEFLHCNSSRKDFAFVTIDCTTLAPDLFESELFGHERGAFTGASGGKKGLFEVADGGTLFLDEIGEMPLNMQVKLLRALETGRFRRVGGTEILSSNVRIVCATNRSLLDCVQKGHFRADLYYRIAAFPVELPPLRERQSDMGLLASCLLDQSADLLGQRHTLSEDALIKLQTYDFPGNIRELRNMLQRAATMSTGGIITADNVELPMREESQPSSGGSSLEDVEARYITDLLQRFEGRRSEVAKVMDISERTLYRKLKRFGLNSRMAFAS